MEKRKNPWPPAPVRGLLCAVLLTAMGATGQTNMPQWYLDAGLPVTDTDGDGIPDAWERRTFGDPAVADAYLDRDGDGLTDLEEFVFGSDPRTASTMGDLWTDREKRDAGLDATNRVVPAVSQEQWLAWLGWSAQTWRTLTATNAEGFTELYAGFVHGAPPYSDGSGTVDFWLQARTDRPAWLTVGDALTTNSFPVRAGTGRVRIRAAYGGPVSLTLDPAPGPLASLPGATNGLWLCGLSVEPARPNTVVFTEGQTPPPPSGGHDSVDGLLLLEPPPSGTVHGLAGPPPSVTLQPLHVTDGMTRLGNGRWYCIPCGTGNCAWPTYGGTGCDPVSLALGRVDADTPVLSPTDAEDILFGQEPLYPLCTVTQTVALTAYPFIYGKVVFTFGQCEAVSGVYGAEGVLGHTPGHDFDQPAGCGGIGCACESEDRWVVGFDHRSVCTRNLVLIEVHDDDEDTMNHCLGVAWSAGGTLNLFGLLHRCHLPYKGDLRFTSDNLKVNGDGELVFGDNPKDLSPDICLVKLHYKPNADTDLIFDKLWVVVNRSDAQTKFDNWYADNADTSWTTNLPSPFANIMFKTNWLGTVGPTVTNLNGSGWGSPHGINSYLHHDAKYEMRSKCVGSHGHQATYTIKGTLITTPIAAGTADFYSPYNAIGTPNMTYHRNADVYPFIRALQLDGNPVHPNSKFAPTNLNRPCIHKGINTDRYIQRRPVLP
jgi:hypothetical protein